MSLFRSLFGRGEAREPAAPKIIASEDYNGYTIKAVAMRADGEFQLAGSIEKVLGGETRTAQFIRADKFASADAAGDASLRKGRQIIDEQGDALFS